MADVLGSLKIVSRGQWGAVPCRGYEPSVPPIRHLVLYHRVWPNQCHDMVAGATMMRELQRIHQKADLSDMHWNFLIASDGVVYEGRGWMREPSKCVRNHEFDGKNYEIGLIGDFENEPVPGEMMEALTKWAHFGVSKGYIDPDYNLVEEKEMLPLIRKKNHKHGLKLTFDYTWISKGKRKKQKVQEKRLRDKGEFFKFSHVPVYPQFGF